MVEMNPHQIKAMHKLRNGTVLRGGVGAGKSRISLAYFMNKVVKAGLKINGHGEDTKPFAPRPLYIITTAKKRDSLEWEEELALFGLMTGETGGWLGQPITVDSWNNIKKYAKVAGAMFIFDEQRLVGSGAWVKAFYQIARKNSWVVLTATPGDDWLDYVPIFVASGFYKSKAEFLRTHAVYNSYATYPKIERYVDTDRLEAYRDRLLVEVDYAPHTKRHMITKTVDFDEDLFKTIKEERWHPWENRPIQDAGELFRLMRKAVNSHSSRLTALKEIFESCSRLIVFYSFDYELEILRGFVSGLNVPYAEWNGHKHMEIPKTPSWIYIVQYTAGSEGWNCTSTDTTLFYSLTYSHKAFEQAKGRIDRMNTPYNELFYYVLRSNSFIDNAIWRTLMRKKTFNERRFAKRHDLWPEGQDDVRDQDRQERQ